MFEIFQAAEIKKCWLCCYTQFFCDYNDKLIQENAEIFEEELCILKKKQNSAVFLNDNFFDLLISETNTDIIFFVLSDDFWVNLDIEKSFSASAEFFQDV